MFATLGTAGRQCPNLFHLRPNHLPRHRPKNENHDGKAEVVIQEAAAYQRLLDVAAAKDSTEGIRQSLADVAAGGTRPAREVRISL